MVKKRTDTLPNEMLPNRLLSDLDELDHEILRLLMSNSSNRDISQKLKMPLSTVQRMTRKLFQSGIVENKVELNFRQVGSKSWSIAHLPS